MDRDEELRRRLRELLEGGQAHVGLDDVTKDWPAELRGVRPPGAAHTPWQTLEHLRIALWDIVEFSRSGDHESPSWPEGYWPPTDAPPSPEAWAESVEGIQRDLAAMQAMISDRQRDLYEPFPWGDGQNLLREALLAADHNAYHLGQLMTLKRLVGAA